MGRAKKADFNQPKTRRKSVKEAQQYVGGTSLEEDAEKLAQGIKNEAKRNKVGTGYNKPPASPSRKLKDMLGGLPLTPEVPKDITSDAIRDYLGSTKPGSKAKPGTFFSDNLAPLPKGAGYAVGSDTTKGTRKYVVAPVKLKGDIPGQTRTINMALRREQFSILGGGDKGKLTYTGRPGEIIPVNGELRKIKPAAPLRTNRPAPKGQILLPVPKDYYSPEKTAERDRTSVNPITEQQNAERAARDAERNKGFEAQYGKDYDPKAQPGWASAPSGGFQGTPTPYSKRVPGKSPNTYDKSTAVQPYGSPKYTGEVTEENTQTGRMTAGQVSGVAERMTKGLRAKGRTNVVSGTMTKVGRGKAAVSYPTYTTSYVPKTAEELAAIPSTAPKTEAGVAAAAAAKTPEQLAADKKAIQGRADINAQKRAQNLAAVRANRPGPKA